MKELIDKPAVPKCIRPNVVTGCMSLQDYVKHLPAISNYNGAHYAEDLLLKSYNENTDWKMVGEQMSFSISLDKQEVFHFWHCHCVSEEIYIQARNFLDKTF